MIFVFISILLKRWVVPCRFSPFPLLVRRLPYTCRWVKKQASSSLAYSFFLPLSPQLTATADIVLRAPSMDTARHFEKQNPQICFFFSFSLASRSIFNFLKILHSLSIQQIVVRPDFGEDIFFLYPGYFSRAVFCVGFFTPMVALC